jgi:hypothetical protein
MVTVRTLKCNIRNYDDDGDGGGGCNNERRKPPYPYNAREPDIILPDNRRKITDFTVWCLFSAKIPELHMY